MLGRWLFQRHIIPNIFIYDISNAGTGSGRGRVVEASLFPESSYSQKSPNFISSGPSVPIVDNELVVSEGISIDVTYVPFQAQFH